MDGDICLGPTFEQDFDVLVHMAAALPGQFADDPDRAFEVNVLGVENALDACRRNGARMVFLSTSGVYAPCQGPVDERAAIELSSLYTKSKFAAEELCRTYSDRHGVSVFVLRVFNVYGSGQQAGVVPYILGNLVGGKEASIMSPASVRDFVHVSDVVEAIVAAASSDIAKGLFNVGAGQGTSIADFIKAAEAIAGKTLRQKFTDGYVDPHAHSVGDISLIGKRLCWAPKVSLKTGLERLLKPV